MTAAFVSAAAASAWLDPAAETLVLTPKDGQGCNTEPGVPMRRATRVSVGDDGTPLTHSGSGPLLGCEVRCSLRERRAWLAVWRFRAPRLVTPFGQTWSAWAGA
jgi:hypothetical protein